MNETACVVTEWRPVVIKIKIKIHFLITVVYSIYKNKFANLNLRADARWLIIKKRYII